MLYVRHRPDVQSAEETTPDGELALVWRVRCTCHTSRPGFFRAVQAYNDLEEHLSEVAPSAEEGCRDSRRHRTRWHDHCELCINQIPLPGFGHLTPATPLEDAR